MKHEMTALKPIAPGEPIAATTPVPVPPTPYERARLMLTAFKYVDGWGETKADGTFKKHNFQKHKDFAAGLVAWALGEGEDG